MRRLVSTDLLGAPLKNHVLLTLVQPPLPHGPEVKNAVLPLQQLIENVLQKKKNMGTKVTFESTAAEKSFFKNWLG